jgi:Tfp pilus assembly protein PilZ
MKPMEERHQERKQIIYFLRVFDANSGTLLGHVEDLNTKGFMVAAERELGRGKTMLLRVELPKNMKGPRHLELKARVKWSKPDADSRFFHIGFGVLRPAKNAEQILSDLIRNFLYQEPPEDEEPAQP